MPSPLSTTRRVPWESGGKRDGTSGRKAAAAAPQPHANALPVWQTQKMFDATPPRCVECDSGGVEFPRFNGTSHTRLMGS